MHVESDLKWIRLQLFGFVAVCLEIQGPAAAQAQAQLLDLEVSRPLTAEEADLLSEIVVQNEIEEAVRSAADNAVPVDSICMLPNCTALARSELRDATRTAIEIAEATSSFTEFSGRSTTPEFTGWGGGVVLPGAATRDGASYLVVGSGSQAGSLVAIGGTGLAAVPLDGSTQVEHLSMPATAEQLGEGIARSTGRTPLSQVLSPNSVPSQIIDGDIRRGGQSRRTFAVKADISPERVAAVAASFVSPGIRARALPEDDPQPASLIAPVDIARFEGSEAQCEVDGSAKPWPYDAAEVIDILKFNEDMIEKLSLPMSRSLVLIVDTGIGSSLLETRFFSPLIAPNERELLNPSVVFNNRLLLPNSLECLDNDNNEYIRDVIGASGSQTSFDLAQCKLGSLGTSSDPRVLPVPRRPGAIESYEPSHGSFVSVLAAGGPDLVFEHPEIARNIGLRFYRVTRPAEGASTKSVRVEPSDMRNAIRYALSQGVSVLNLSMKSSDANLRPLFADGALENTLVVTSAGNRRENLSLEGDRALPAGLSNENLLVVGAVMDNAEGSWWDDSAFGDSVNIAAPGVNVRSFDDTGASVCFTGTSAAAPIVTFTGALLFSFGMQNAKEVKKRILYSAEIDDSLVGKVRHSKRLNVPAAIDIFVDRIVLADTGALLRGRIVADSEERMIRVCSGAEGEPLAGAMGWIDPYYIRSWHLSDGQAMFEDSRNSDTPRSCSIAPSSSLNFRPIGSDDTISILFDAIESIVLSPFRSAEVEGAVLQ